MSRTLIVPDIHTQHTKAQRIIDYVGADKVVFLGDYFDNFHDTPEMNFNTTIWVTNRMEQHPEDQFLLGNHDVPYVWGLEFCSGFSIEKAAAIDATGEVQRLRNNLKLFTLVDEILISHAGLTNALVPKNHEKDLMNWLSRECTKAKFNMKEGVSHWTIAPGLDRGGYALYGGLTWCDWNNFKPIKGIKQICGHTKGYLPRYLDGNHCIDTALKHYALIEDGLVSIHSLEEEVIKGITGKVV
jgi:hypothetical protein